MNAVYEIAKLGSAVLRQTALAVTDCHREEPQAIIAAMHTILAGSQGVGIAAPQIGISLQIIIVASRPTLRYPNAPLMEPTVMINPKFTAVTELTEKGWEGCLSVPGIRALVPRFKHIQIYYTDPEGQPQQAQLDGFVARVFQHEYDHLHGLVFLDRIETTQDIMTESEYFKLTT